MILDSPKQQSLAYQWLMAKYYNWFFLLPILLLLLGTYILLSGEIMLHTLKSEGITVGQQASQGTGLLQEGSTFGSEMKDNRDSAFQYFVLGAGLLIALLLFPKLGELSFSPTNGFTLKVLSDVKEAIEEVQAATLAVEHKTKQAFRAIVPEAAVAPESDWKEDLTRLEAGRLKLEAYAALLEKIAAKKR